MLIKIRINPLGAIEHIIFREGFLLCLCLTNMPFVGENIISAEGKKLVDAGGKLLHGESVFSLNQVFDVIKVAGNSSLKLTKVDGVVCVKPDERFEGFFVAKLRRK